MKAHERACWRLTSEQQRELRSRLDAVDAEAGEDDARFLALLAAWGRVHKPWDAPGPTVHAYHLSTAPGAPKRWLVDDVPGVVAAIHAHVEEEN